LGGATLNYTQLVAAVEERTGTHTRTGTFVNDGQLELAKEAQNTEKASITFASGVASIPATCLEVVAILWDGDRVNLKPSDMEIDDGTSDPTGYIIKNGQIVLDTKISETQTDGLLYVPRPPTMAGVDTAYLPDCDEALIKFARFKIYEDLEHTEKAAYWEIAWLKAKEEWLKGHKRANKRVRRARKTRSWA
jgi:hypothetical protein